MPVLVVLRYDILHEETHRRGSRTSCVRLLPGRERWACSHLSGMPEREMVREALGESSTLQDMVNLINDGGAIRPGWHITLEQRSAVVGMCRLAGWPAPEEFSLHPINSVAALSHWRCLTVFVGEITPQGMEKLRHRYPSSGLRRSSGTSTISRSPLEQIPFSPRQKVLQQEEKHIPPSRSRGNAPYPEPENVREEVEVTVTRESSSLGEEKTIVHRFDSHFHLDRLSVRVPGIQLTNCVAIEQVFPQGSDKHYTVRLSGAAAVFCDQNTLPLEKEIPALTIKQGFSVMIGAHPKTILTDKERQRVKSLIQHPSVIGLGEVGLDHSVNSDLWHLQERQLRDLLTGLHPSRVLTLHIRGMRDDFTGVETYMRCLDVISPVIKGSQKIQLHCFSSTTEVVQQWLESFPNTHFSIGNMVNSFNGRQKAALKSVPRNQLLLETDAPYFPQSAGNRTPHLCWTTQLSQWPASWETSHRKKSWNSLRQTLGHSSTDTGHTCRTLLT